MVSRHEPQFTVRIKQTFSPIPALVPFYMTLIKFTCLFILARHIHKLGIIVVREIFAIKCDPLTRIFESTSLNSTPLVFARLSNDT